MEGSGRFAAKAMLLGLVTVAAMVTCGMCQLPPPPPQLLKVGETDGWKPNVNYTKWAASKQFFVGYWIQFNFDKHLYTVFEVNKTSYDQCNDKGFIKNITRGGRDVFNLTEARPYYFLSGGGYCWNGMKLAINVVDYPAHAPSLAPAPAPAKNDGFAIMMKSDLLVSIVLQITLVWALLSRMF